jgi:choline monooxygenase
LRAHRTSIPTVRAGADLGRVEREDKTIVMRAQRGLRSRLYRRRRYAPDLERAVHRFHVLLARALGDARAP